MSNLVVPLREVLTVVAFIAVPVAVSWHRRNAGGLLRGMYLPIALIAICQAVALGVFFTVRHAAPTPSALHVLIWTNVSDVA